jgi:hypothetical protein
LGGALSWGSGGGGGGCCAAVGVADRRGRPTAGRRIFGSDRGADDIGGGATLTLGGGGAGGAD